MASSASHPSGFSQRWQRAGSAESVSSASPDRDAHVSGMGLSSASSGNGVEAPRVELTPQVPAAERGRVHDRLAWEQPRPSKKTMWRRRVEARADATAGRGAAAPEMDGLCFRCYEPGHRKRECTNDELCVRCWVRGHPARECKRPRSPASEEELRNLALAKLARRRSPVRAAQVGSRRGPVRESARAAAPLRHRHGLLRGRLRLHHHRRPRRHHLRHQELLRWPLSP
ncbi:hypothetical protein QYE76_013151 [Lolium multiflorum]|uniref:CCHC-type domain-containing protein n=1 Tax=Lolium multiflorum TaxID=4521 RepID=A0AAD8X7C6_LOLMU|nr:hypothetical protein QYE76_013151 [Lolium multiflorum]